MFLRILILVFAFAIAQISSYEICPANPSGIRLRCAFRCCDSLEGDGETQGYYCCGVDSDARVESVTNDYGRAERFISYANGFQIDYTLLVIGIIISIVVSIILSLLCCLLCNGCWLHRRRNPENYESVNDSAFYPICCGFGIPLGTIVFSTHPPQFNPEHGGYSGSSTSSLPSSRNRVRFNEDGTPRGVLKNSNDGHFSN
ncbi:hypothetical protein FO519_000097 [Halicephalobus sp. NKZ332]|nr:hypothetical protein FO519_000097 [Halicephalobus sp. NKZ332]